MMMNFPQPIKRNPTSEGVRGPAGTRIKTSVLVAHQLADQVRKLPLGTSLPPERELIAEFGVARSTMREALRLLELQGLLRIKAGPRGGPIVAKPDHRALADSLSLTLQSSDVTFKDVVEARKSVESQIGRLAAVNATLEEMDELDASIERLANADDFEDHRTENMVFHELCAQAARNRVLELFHASLRAINDGHVMGVSYSRRRQLAVVEAHKRIVAAIRARDAAAAEVASREHMEEFEDYLARRYASLLDQPVRWKIHQV